MVDRICIPLADGRWITLDREVFEVALAAGVEFGRPSGQARAWPAPEELLTADQLADRLKLPQSWIEQATREGRLPYHEFGRYRRYSLAAVIEATKQERRKNFEY